MTLGRHISATKPSAGHGCPSVAEAKDGEKRPPLRRHSIGRICLTSEGKY